MNSEVVPPEIAVSQWPPLITVFPAGHVAVSTSNCVDCVAETNAICVASSELPTAPAAISNAPTALVAISDEPTAPLAISDAPTAPATICLKSALSRSSVPLKSTLPLTKKTWFWLMMF